MDPVRFRAGESRGACAGLQRSSRIQKGSLLGKGACLRTRFQELEDDGLIGRGHRLAAAIGQRRRGRPVKSCVRCLAAARGAEWGSGVGGCEGLVGVRGALELVHEDSGQLREGRSRGRRVVTGGPREKSSGAVIIKKGEVAGARRASHAGPVPARTVKRCTERVHHVGRHKGEVEGAGDAALLADTEAR